MVQNSPDVLGNVKEDGMVRLLDGYGACFTLDDDKSLAVEIVEDHHYEKIHPNCYAPARLQDVYLLHGGGSGTAVFHGHDPKRWGSLVMKHSGSKENREVFALATIASEIKERSRSNRSGADYMAQRIPGFKMLYLSPFHLRDRTREVWMSMRGSVWSAGDTEDSTPNKMAEKSLSQVDPAELLDCAKHGKRTICITISDGESMSIDMGFTSVEIGIPQKFLLRVEDRRIIVQHGYERLEELGVELLKRQTSNQWKVTIAQRKIGDEMSQNGAEALLKRNLVDDILEHLLSDFVETLRALESLTYDSEKHRLDAVRQEALSLQDIGQVSPRVDQFVGNAIIKNFDPEKGRFPFLRSIGINFSKNVLHLLDSEKEPARLLGKLLKDNCDMSTVFIDPPAQVSMLDVCKDSWKIVLIGAVSLPESSMVECVWNCGLNDAGLHNAFMSSRRGVDFFDLGEPSVQPLPALLTKFLMSFFHAAGMEQDGTSWVCRFSMVDGKAALTPSTVSLLKYIDGTFTTVLKRLINELFQGNDAVQPILIQYIILQLVSDASFCLKRFRKKGGGDVRLSESSKHLEKWLWRCLWDMFVASHVYARYNEHGKCFNDSILRQNGEKREA